MFVQNSVLGFYSGAVFNNGVGATLCNRWSTLTTAPGSTINNAGSFSNINYSNDTARGVVNSFGTLNNTGVLTLCGLNSVTGFTNYNAFNNTSLLTVGTATIFNNQSGAVLSNFHGITNVCGTVMNVTNALFNNASGQLNITGGFTNEGTVYNQNAGRINKIAGTLNNAGTIYNGSSACGVGTITGGLTSGVSLSSCPA